MTLTSDPRERHVAAPPPSDRRTRSPIWKLLTTTDHKTIGLMYIVTSFAFFMLGGVLALLMRAELARPGLQFFSNEQYNQLFTMHGTIMLLMFATPIVFGFANFIMPLQIGSPDVSFPRLNALSYWLYLFGSLIAVSGFLTPEGAADFGWFALRPAQQRHPLPERGRGPVGRRADDLRPRHHPGRGQHAHYDPDAARTGDDDVPDADLHLEHPGDVDHGPDGLPATGGDPAGAGGGPAPGRARVRRRERRRDPLAAPVLVLRPSRGLHRRDPVLRDHYRGHSGLQPQAGLRLQGAGRGDYRDRRAVDDGLGAPHVRHRRGAAAVLLLPVLPDRHPDRGQVLQLDRDDVARLDHVRDGDAVRVWLPGHVSVRRPVRGDAGLPADRLPRDRHLFRGGAFPLRAVRHDRVRRLRRDLLLVPEDDRPDAQRVARSGALLDPARRLPPDLPGAALAGPRGDAAAVRRLPAHRRLHHLEHDLDHRVVPSRRLDAAVPVERVALAQTRRVGRRARPVGLRQLTRVGDELPAATAQLHHHPADPLGAAGLRPARSRAGS